MHFRGGICICRRGGNGPGLPLMKIAKPLLLVSTPLGMVTGPIGLSHGQRLGKPRVRNDGTARRGCVYAELYFGAGPSPPKRSIKRAWFSIADLFRRVSPPAIVSAGLQQGGAAQGHELIVHQYSSTRRNCAVSAAGRVSIAPGPIFSARREFAHCLRLNYGHEWTAASERAIKTLGSIVRS
jgi:hypothetical protein